MWHRLKPASDMEPRCTDVGTPIFGKRDPVEVKMADAGTPKKLKQGTETMVEAATSNAVAAVMRVLAWNCLGLGKPRVVKALKGVVKDEDPNIIFLSETMHKASEKEKIQRRLGLSNELYVDCRGEDKHWSGGLALFWKVHLELALKSCSVNHIEMEGLGSDGNPI